ncbi:hypothetical protein SCA6_002447 [Theobroma cacao]
MPYKTKKLNKNKLRPQQTNTPPRKKKNLGRNLYSWWVESKEKGRKLSLEDLRFKREREL